MRGDMMFNPTIIEEGGKFYEINLQDVFTIAPFPEGVDGSLVAAKAAQESLKWQLYDRFTPVIDKWRALSIPIFDLPTPQRRTMTSVRAEWRACMRECLLLGRTFARKAAKTFRRMKRSVRLCRSVG